MKQFVFLLITISYSYVGTTLAQAQPGTTRFDAASVKGNPEAHGHPDIETSGNSLTIRRASLAICIRWAYSVRRDQVAGPPWINSKRFDISAKVDKPASENEIRMMLQSLLIERFKLALHHETKALPIYMMSLAKGRTKLVKSNPATQGGNPRIGRESYEIPHVTMAAFARLLSDLGAVDYPVVDRTGLADTFDISLKFPEGSRPSPLPDSNGVSTFSLLEEQLGLKLELQQLPTDVLVIDHAEKVPVDN